MNQHKKMKKAFESLRPDINYNPTKNGYNGSFFNNIKSEFDYFEKGWNASRNDIIELHGVLHEESFFNFLKNARSNSIEDVYKNFIDHNLYIDAFLKNDDLSFIKDVIDEIHEQEHSVYDILIKIKQILDTQMATCKLFDLVSYEYIKNIVIEKQSYSYDACKLDTTNSDFDSFVGKGEFNNKYVIDLDELRIQYDTFVLQYKHIIDVYAHMSNV